MTLLLFRGLVAILTAINLWLANACQYSVFSPSHTLCRFKAPGCPLITSGVSSSEASFILDTHNRMRQKIANGQEPLGASQPTAANMKQMEWDTELASLAQRWAEQCKTQHDCPDCRQVPRFRVGQNVYMFASTEDNATSDWDTALNEWYREVALFRINQIEPFRHTGPTGHYSQLLWANTYKIGCGWAYYKKDIWYTKLYVCDYGPAGNILGDQMYMKGASCSACPEDTSCSNQYYGLCGSGGGSVSSGGDGGGGGPVSQPWWLLTKQTTTATTTTTTTSKPWWLTTTGLTTSSRPLFTKPFPSKKVFMRCDFDTKGCKVETVGNAVWLQQRSNSYQGNFYEVKVRPGEDAHLYLYLVDDGFSGSGGVGSFSKTCLTFMYRKYSDTSSPPPSESPDLEVALWRHNQPDAFAEQRFGNPTRTWSQGKVTAAAFSDVYAVSFHLNANDVPSDLPTQYLSLDNIRLDAGPCN